MIKSINYWSYPGGLQGSLDPRAMIQQAARDGYQAVELCFFEEGGVSLSATEQECADLAGFAAENGVPVLTAASGLYWSNALGDSDSAARATAAHQLERMIERTAWLGAKTLLTIPGSVDVFFLPERPRQPYEEVMRYAVEGLRPMVPLAEERGIALGFENVWNRILMSPAEMASFIDQFESNAVGAYFDVGNVLPFGYPEDWIEYLGPRIKGIHFKDFRRSVGTADGFVDLLEGDVEWPAVMAALRAIGYTGPVVAELIPGYRHCPEVRPRNASQAMDAILAL